MRFTSLFGKKFRRDAFCGTNVSHFSKASFNKLNLRRSHIQTIATIKKNNSSTGKRIGVGGEMRKRNLSGDVILYLRKGTPDAAEVLPNCIRKRRNEKNLFCLSDDNRFIVFPSWIERKHFQMWFCNTFSESSAQWLVLP